MPVRDVKLYEGTGYVEIDKLPVETECFVLFLTNREIHILSRFFLPFATWATRLVRFVHPKAGQWPGSVFQTATDAEFSDYLQEIDQLSLKLEGDNVSCTEIADGLNAIAAALAGQEGGCVTNVDCGGSCGTATLGNALAGIPDANYTDAAAQTPPEEGVPPEGFESWGAYQTWKCQAAHAIWMEIDRFMILLEGFDGLVVLASVAAPAVAAFAGVSFAAITVGGIVTIVAAILAMAAVWVSNALIINQMRTWWNTNQSAILCQLYDSGDAATALSALGSAVEDMLQAIEWGTILGPVSGPLSLALGGAIGAVETNSLVNPLFKLVTGVALVGVECPCQPAGLLLETAQDYPYNSIVWGDSFTAADNGDWFGFKAQTPTDANFYFTPRAATTMVKLTGQYYKTENNTQVLEFNIRRVSGDQHIVGFTIPNTNGGWVSFDNNQVAALTAGVQYRLWGHDTGGHYPFMRALKLEAI